VSVLRKLADAAERAGDEISAQTWHAIAEAADRILTTGYGSSGIFRPPGMMAPDYYDRDCRIMSMVWNSLAARLG
jgi:hypothetical protein